MKLIKCLLTENKCYVNGVKITPCGIMLHSTGANNPTLKRYVQPSADEPARDKLLDLLGVNYNCNDWNQPTPDGIKVCVHGFIGRLADKSIASVQTLPWNMMGWHSGYFSKHAKTNANKLGYIGIEICEDGLTDPEYFKSVYAESIDLCEYLCRIYGLDPKKPNTIICHSEGHKAGIASNHGDVMHWFPKHGKNMDDFRKELSERLAKKEPSKPPYKHLGDVPDWHRPAIQKLMEKGVLNGTEDADPDSLNDNVLNLSEDFCRIMTVLNNLKLF